MSAPELSIVLPCYNERASLAAAVSAYCHDLPATGIEEFELIVVDDGSTDGSGELAEELARFEPRLRVLHHERNQGQVAGILTGFRAAGGRIVTHNGIDLPFAPRETARMLALLRAGADVVVVQRTNRTAYSLARKVVSWCNVLLLRVLFRSRFTDHNFVQFYRRDVVRGLPVLARGVSTLSPELIVRAARAGRRVESSASPYYERQVGSSTITPLKVLHAVVDTFRLWWHMLPGAPRTASRPSLVPAGGGARVAAYNEMHP